VLSVAAVHLDNGGLVTIGIGIRAGATECLGPVSAESLDMLGVEAVAEGMADHVVGHHPTMPGFGKTAQAVVATRRLENSLHASMMTIVPSLCKMMAARRVQPSTRGHEARARGGLRFRFRYCGKLPWKNYLCSTNSFRCLATASAIDCEFLLSPRCLFTAAGPYHFGRTRLNQLNRHVSLVLNSSTGSKQTTCNFPSRGFCLDLA